MNALASRLLSILTGLVAMLVVVGGFMGVAWVVGDLARAGEPDPVRSYPQAADAGGPKEPAPPLNDGASARSAAPKRSTTPTPATPPKPPAKIAWRKDYAAALAEHDRTGKPVWLHFTEGPSCAPCVIVKRDVFTQPAFIAIANRDVIPVQITRDTRIGRETFDLFGVTATPTDVVLTRKHRVTAAGKLNARTACQRLSTWARRAREESVLKRLKGTI